MAVRWRRGRQRFSDVWRRNFGTELGADMLDGVLPTYRVHDTGTRDVFGATIEHLTNPFIGLGTARPAIVTLWAGSLECLVWNVSVRQVGQELFNRPLLAWVFTPPQSYRFAAVNGVVLAGPGFGAIFDRGIDFSLRQSQAVILAGNPFVLADVGVLTPALNPSESSTGHPVVQTGGGPVILRGPSVEIFHPNLLNAASHEWGPAQGINLLPGPVRLRRFDAISVITAHPTLITARVPYIAQAALAANFVWSEIPPAYEPTRQGFVGHA